MTVAERTKVCGYSECHAHGEPQPWTNFYARTRHEDGSPATVRAFCKDCERKRVAKWRTVTNPERARELSREAQQRRMADPERAAIRREQWRKWARKKRGVTPDRYRTSHYMRETPDGLKPVLVEAAPFAAWLDTLSIGTVEFAGRAGVADSILRRVKRRDQEWVAIDTVDRCAMAMGVRIEDIYGD